MYIYLDFIFLTGLREKKTHNIEIFYAKCIYMNDKGHVTELADNLNKYRKPSTSGATNIKRICLYIHICDDKHSNLNVTLSTANNSRGYYSATATTFSIIHIHIHIYWTYICILYINK